MTTRQPIDCTDRSRARRAAAKVGVLGGVAALASTAMVPMADAGLTPQVWGPAEALTYSGNVFHQGSAAIGGDCSNSVCTATIEVEFKRPWGLGWGDVSGSKRDIAINGSRYYTNESGCAGTHKYSTMLKLTLHDFGPSGTGITLGPIGVESSQTTLVKGTVKLRSSHQPTLDCVK